MEYHKKTVSDVDVKGKKVLLRCDLNVSLDKAGNIVDDKRIRESLPTIEYLLENGAAVIVCSHLGKPKGQVKPELSLKPVAERMSELMGRDIIFTKDVTGPDAKAKAAALKPGEVMLLENLRFDKGEEADDPAFAKALADMAELFVSDAFGTVHRAHASTVGVPKYLPAVSGFLIQKELTNMGNALEHPKRPLVALLGGSKVSDKIGMIHNMLEKADKVLVGGGMAFTFLKAKGLNVGASLLEEEKIDFARELMEQAPKEDVRFLLPVDVAVSEKFEDSGERKLVDVNAIPDGWMGLDIGDRTIELYKEELKGAGTIIWNGPMGVFEMASFAKGTNEMAKTLAESGAITVVGGGESATAIDLLGLADKMTHISTGGGASLQFFEGRELPGIACLLDKQE